MSADSIIPHWREEVWAGWDSSFSAWFRLENKRYQVSGYQSMEHPGKYDIEQLQVFYSGRWWTIPRANWQFKRVMKQLRAAGKIV